LAYATPRIFIGNASLIFSESFLPKEVEHGGLFDAKPTAIVASMKGTQKWHDTFSAIFVKKQSAKSGTFGNIDGQSGKTGRMRNAEQEKSAFSI